MCEQLIAVRVQVGPGGTLTRFPADFSFLPHTLHRALCRGAASALKPSTGLQRTQSTELSELMGYSPHSLQTPEKRQCLGVDRSGASSVRVELSRMHHRCVGRSTVPILTIRVVRGAGSSPGSGQVHPALDASQQGFPDAHPPLFRFHLRIFSELLFSHTPSRRFRVHRESGSVPAAG